MTRATRGFTLIELLVVVVVGSIVLLATLQVLLTNQRIYTAHNARVQGSQSTRAALAVLTSELREISPPGGDLLMMDVDSFKSLNDEHGHLAGDRFLQRVGEVIKGNLRSHDIPCRYGGEEFAVLLPETEPAEAIVIAERIRRTVAEIRLREGRRVVGTTISIGISSYPRSARRSATDILRKADGALYQAKREGKDKVIAAA